MTKQTQSTSEETGVQVEGIDGQASLQEGQQPDEETLRLEKTERKAVKRYYREQQLQAYQAELIKMQEYVEEQNERVIILFEGRDASGKVAPSDG